MKALELARYVVNLCIDNDSPVSNLHLQKILYFANMFYFKKNGEHLIDDNFEAWQFGPVIREVYYQYVIFGFNLILIKERSTQVKLDDELNNFIIKMSKINPFVLVDYSHRPNGAWAKTYNNGNGFCKNISKKFYRRRGFTINYE